MHVLRRIGIGLAVIGLSLAAFFALLWIHPYYSVTLLVYLPGIVIAEALFGPWAGLASVLISVIASGLYHVRHLATVAPGHMLLLRHVLFQELILLIVGLFIVWLMDQRTRHQRDLARGTQQLATIVETVSDAVVIFGSNFRVAAMNPAAHKMLDRPGETLVGEHAVDLAKRFQFTPENGSVLPTNFEQASRAGLIVHEQGTILDISRKRHTDVMIHAIPRRTPWGAVEGSIVIVTDLSAIKDLQARLLECARQAAVGRMFSGLSHDFNHVLDIVRRALAVLDLHENASAEERRRYREMIDRAAVDGGQIVRRLRDYLAGGDVRTRVNLAAVAQEAIDLTRPLWRNRPALEIVQHLQQVPSITGHRNDLQRILVNLLFNAIESLGAQPGQITIQTEADDQHVRAWVEDNGPGIAPDVLPRLFHAYFTTKPQGMGLGLFGAAEMAAQHGGTLRVDSDPGKATRFTLELPRPQPEVK